jgi:hypothetical protein
LVFLLTDGWSGHWLLADFYGFCSVHMDGCGRDAGFILLCRDSLAEELANIFESASLALKMLKNFARFTSFGLRKLSSNQRRVREAFGDPKPRPFADRIDLKGRRSILGAGLCRKVVADLERTLAALPQTPDSPSRGRWRLHEAAGDPKHEIKARLDLSSKIRHSASFAVEWCGADQLPSSSRSAAPYALSLTSISGRRTSTASLWIAASSRSRAGRRGVRPDAAAGNAERATADLAAIFNADWVSSSNIRRSRCRSAERRRH